MQNIISEVQGFFSAGTVGAYIALGLYGLVALLALVGAFKGLTRGVCRQTIRLVTVGGAAVLSFFVCRLVFPKFVEIADGKTLGETLAVFRMEGLLNFAGSYGSVISGVDGETAQYLSAIPIAVILLPLLFVLLFILFSGLLFIVHALVCGALGFSSARANPLTRLLGFVMGAVQGVLVGALVLVPAFSLCSFTKAATADMESDSTIRTMYTSYLEPAADSTLLDLVGKYGGNYVVDSFHTVTLGEEEVDVGTSAETLFTTAAKVIGSTSGADWNSLTAEQQKAIDDAIHTIGGDSYLATVTSGVLRNLSISVTDDPSLLPTEDGATKNLLLDFIAIFRDSSADTVETDLLTLTKVYYMLSDEGVLTAVANNDADAVITGMTATDAEGKTLTRRVTDTLEENPRTAPLVAAMGRFTAAVMAEAMDSDIDTVQLYENLKNGLKNDILSHRPENYADDAAYGAAVAGSLKNLLADNGITLPQEVSDHMADYIAENYRELLPEDATDGDIADILLSYYAAAKAE